MPKNENVLAYMKYDGKLVENGFLDAKKSADVLYGFDKALRYFLYQENSEVQNIEFEIPVRIGKGSWETWIPDTIEKMLLVAGTVSASAYGKKAMEKMAENDFKNIGFKDLFKKSFKSLIWVIKIAKHYGTMNKREFQDTEFLSDNRVVKLKNQVGEEINVPIEYLEKYVDCPETLFSQISKIIEVERELEIGVIDKDIKPEEKIVKITVKEKEIFYKQNEDEDVLFPELKDGDYVELEGHVTRGNENANTIGFYYNSHVITCYPADGNIINFKSQLFSNCLMKGYVDRTSKEGAILEKRPRIKFIDLILLDKPYPTLFS